MKGVFDPNYVKRLHGTYLKEGGSKWDLAQQLIEEIQASSVSAGSTAR